MSPGSRGAPARRAMAMHFTESVWPSKALTKGLAKIFSIFTALRAR